MSSKANAREAGIVRRERLPRPEDRLALGSSGLLVSPFCLGMTRDPATVVRAFEAGINHFFVTADMHWPLYEATRVGLARILRRRGVRDRIVVSAVSYVAQPEFSVAPFLEVIATVRGLERLDVLVAGGVRVVDAADRMARFREQVEGGFVGARATGATFHERSAARVAFTKSRSDWIGVRYNALHPGADVDVFPHVRPDRGPLVLGFKAQTGFVRPEKVRPPRARAATLPDRGDAYRFALTPRAVHGQLVGLSTPAEVDALERALERGPMTSKERERCMRLARSASAA